MDDECTYCHGDGMDPATLLLPCPYCDGTGGALLGYDDDGDAGYDDDDDDATPQDQQP